MERREHQISRGAPASSRQGIEHDTHETATQQGQPEFTRGMTDKESIWWTMSFEELYQLAKSSGFGKGKGKEGRKSGRIRIIKWLCKNEGITRYVAPTVAPVVDAPIITRPIVRPTGAIAHPEAILRTNDEALQKRIDEVFKDYIKLPSLDLLALCMARSYQLLKDSQGKLPSKSCKAMANWLAAWDVLKSPREKKWWLGDGIDLVNKAKAMGYEGPSSPKKYDVILWLRSTPEEAEITAAGIAEPTPNKKRKGEEAPLPTSKRPAKGSKRLHGWGL